MVAHWRTPTRREALLLLPLTPTVFVAAAVLPFSDSGCCVGPFVLLLSSDLVLPGLVVVCLEPFFV